MESPHFSCLQIYAILLNMFQAVCSTCTGYSFQFVQSVIMPRFRRAEALSDDACLTSVCLCDVCLSDTCLSVAYIGPKSRTERPRKTKIGTEVAHVTHD